MDVTNQQPCLQRGSVFHSAAQLRQGPVCGPPASSLKYPHVIMRFHRLYLEGHSILYLHVVLKIHILHWVLGMYMPLFLGPCWWNNVIWRNNLILWSLNIKNQGILLKNVNGSSGGWGDVLSEKNTAISPKPTLSIAPPGELLFQWTYRFLPQRCRFNGSRYLGAWRPESGALELIPSDFTKTARIKNHWFRSRSLPTRSWIFQY